MFVFFTFRRFENIIEGGTAIGTAIAASAKRLSNREAKSKIVVLLTDGVQSVPGLSPEDAATEAMRDKLSTLKDVSISPEYPDLRESLLAVKAVINDQHLQAASSKSVTEEAN